MFLNKKHFLLFITVLIVMMTACVAVNVDDTTNDTQEVSKNTHTNLQTDNNEITTTNDNTINTHNNKQTVKEANYEAKDTYSESTKTFNTQTEQTIIITPENFDNYVTNGEFNDKIKQGAYLDFSGKFDDEHYAINITKPVNIFSSKHDAFISLHSTQRLESGYPIPYKSFRITSGGSGTNVTGIYFENTMIVTLKARDIIFDDLTIYCTTDYGWGLGATSIRQSQNVLIKNSYFNTTAKRVWVSTMVFAASKNCTIENCTVVGSGYIGNLVYATTYNVEVDDKYGNSNITIRNNTIIGREIVQGIDTCYSVCAIGDNITVENNYIENNNGLVIMSQYGDETDEIYIAEGSPGRLDVINNTLGPGKIGVIFDPCVIANNTFYGNVILDTPNTAIKENNTVKPASENPYTTFKTAQEHDATITITAPTKYYYYSEATINITLKEDDNITPINEGRLELYIDGKPYRNITVNNSQISLVYANETLGTHRIRAWYYKPGSNISNSQKQVTLESIPISGTLQLQTQEDVHIGDTITLNVSYTLEEEAQVDVNITFELPGQQSITLPAKDNRVSLQTTITNDYIRDILGGRERSIKITATTNDTNVQIKEISTKLGVKKANTQITITPQHTVYNTPTTITATIKTPNNLTINTGTITFKDQDGNIINTKYVKNNEATTTVIFNNTQPTPITATYSGTTYYEANTTTTGIDVQKQDMKITIDKIQDVTYGHEVTITGTFKDGLGNARANIALKILINGKSISTRTDLNGIFSVNSKVGVLGVNNVTASHAGGTNYNPTNTSSTFKMIKQDLKISVDKMGTVVYGSSVNISGTLKDGDGNLRANTGVKILINGKSATAKTDKNGNYVFTIKIGKLGVNNVTVSHNGGTNYNPASASTTYTVVKKDLKITLNPIGTVTYGSVTITGLFTDSKGTPRANTGLKISINGKTATAKTDATGHFTLTSKVGVIGVNNVTAYHNGGGNYNPTSTNVTFIMKKQDLKVKLDAIKDVTYGNSVVITGTFTDASGKVRANSALKISINGKTLTTRTDASGKFRANSKVGSIGVNNVTVSHNGGTGFNPTSTSTTFKMVKQDLKITINLISNVKKGSTVTVTGTFTDANGKIRANTNLKVSFNGVEYTTRTDSKGVFTFTTTANKVGSNTIIISHAGGANYNPTSSMKSFTVLA